jgi:hypothetical protein
VICYNYLHCSQRAAPTLVMLSRGTHYARMHYIELHKIEMLQCVNPLCLKRDFITLFLCRLFSFSNQEAIFCRKCSRLNCRKHGYISKLLNFFWANHIDFYAPGIQTDIDCILLKPAKQKTLGIVHIRFQNTRLQNCHSSNNVQSTSIVRYGASLTIYGHQT